MEHSFQVGDQVWFYIRKDRIQGEGKKLKPIRYGPFRIPKTIGENALRLDLPTYMQIYSVMNANCLRLFEPSMIKDPEEQSQLPSVDDLLPEYLNELQEDTVLDRKVQTMCSGQVEYLRIGLKGSKPSSMKWIEIGQERTEEACWHQLDGDTWHSSSIHADAEQGTPSTVLDGESAQAGEELNRHMDWMVKAMDGDSRIKLEDLERIPSDQERQ
eukprot:PITA_10104